jgi:hypothetical protein
MRGGEVDEREQRLPKWAQKELESLRRQVRNAERAAEEARLATSPDESDTIIDRYTEGPIGLGKGARVRFLPEGHEGDGWHHHNYLEVRVEDGGIQVHAGGQLSILPRVSNSVQIKVVDR